MCFCLSFFKFWKRIIITFFKKNADLSPQDKGKMFKLLLKSLINFMAERMGFEPMIEFPLYMLSKRAPSTTRPPLHYFSLDILSTPMNAS